MHTLLVKSALALSAITFLFIGVFLTFFPAYLFGLNGLTLDPSAAMMSDIRAPGVPVLLGGIIALTGLMNRSYERFALVISAGLLLSYGAGRLISLQIDGTPPDFLLFAAVIELGLGGWCAWLFARASKTSANLV